MVISGVESSRNNNSNKNEDYATMAMAPERSRNLHNFSLPSWGRTMQLRCIKIDENSDVDTTDHLTSSLSHHRSRSAYHGFSGFGRGAVGIEKKRRSFCDGRLLLDSKRISAASSDNYTRITGSRPKIVIGRDKLSAQFNYDGGIADISKELIKEYTREGVKIREAIISHESSDEIEHLPELTTTGPPHQPKTMTTSTEVAAVTTTTTTTDVDNKPWNLRTRRAVCKEPNSDGGGFSSGCVGGVGINGGNGHRIDDWRPNPSPYKTPITTSTRLRSEFVGGGRFENGNGGGEKRPREKFTISLSRKEIEEDFIKILGTKPARKPINKRPKTVQKQLDNLFPGFWLTEITPDMYKVKANE